MVLVAQQCLAAVSAMPLGELRALKAMGSPHWALVAALRIAGGDADLLELRHLDVLAEALRCRRRRPAATFRPALPT